MAFCAHGFLWASTTTSQVLTDSKGKRLDSNHTLASLELDLASLVSLNSSDLMDHTILIPLKKGQENIRVRLTVHAK